ncbi:MAG: hypothetical protein HQL32_04465, partial [Planctomycetes bacterium]|nr:hypothetical protein [Planctomycetota bacterium]
MSCVHGKDPWQSAYDEMRFFQGKSIEGVDTKTLNGKIVCGYQGWFNTPDDGYSLGWKHYSSEVGRRKGQFKPGFSSIEFWPHTSEFPAEALTETKWRKKNGSPAKVFTSTHPGVVMKHFEWMQEYGIEAAFLQRFVGPTVTKSARFRKNNRILDNVRTAANATGRA